MANPDKKPIITRELITKLNLFDLISKTNLGATVMEVKTLLRGT